MSEAPSHAFGLDAIRACAVGSVLLAHGSLFHVAGPQSPARYLLVIFGVLGVEIFFALSGFLVGRQLLLVAEGEAGAGRFLVRRWVRTLPNYYLFLLVNAALVWWVIDRQGPDARFLMFSQALAWPATSAFFPESWSLAVEEWFYGLAAVGFAAAAAGRASPRAVGLGIAAVIVAGPLARWGAQALSTIAIDAGVRKISLLRLDALAFGLGCAWLERHRPAAFERLTRADARAVGIALALAGIALLAFWARDLAVFEPARGGGEAATAALLFSALPLAAALLLPWLSRWGRSDSWMAAPVARMSAWSYSIYLTHFPLLLVFLARWPVAPGDEAAATLRTVTWLALAIALAAAVYHFYEAPLMKRRPALRAPPRGAGA